MVALPKSYPHTFFNGSNSTYPPSNLDHVFAADHITFADVDATGAKVFIGGWVLQSTDAKKDDWIAKFSDHAPIIFTVTDTD